MGRARHFVTWSSWARRSLIEDYGIDGGLISVVSPGVDLDMWPRLTVRPSNGKVRVLFVGGDFARKGGHVLLQACSGLDDVLELHVVTTSHIEPDNGVRVHRDLAPNSTALMNLFATADLFVLPTLGDCLAIAILEAMAAGLPVVATDVGAIGEVVRDGETGFLVAPSDVASLRSALVRLIGDRNLRAAMGMRAREDAERQHDSAANAKRILHILCTVAGRSS
jgi:glycosyltransferase involved in cell wall biosynthesis